MPRIKQSLANSSDFEVGSNLGNQAPPELREDGSGPMDMEVIRPEDFHNALKMEKFMNEKVEIEIEPDHSNENAPEFVHLGHNGTTQYVHRGRPQIIKRKYLYSALVSRQVRMNCTFEKGANGKDINDLKPQASSTHRVRLIADNNPHGGSRWVQQVMREESTSVRA